MINAQKLDAELKNAGIQISGCNTNGKVWDVGNNEIQSRADVAAVIAAHNPEDTPVTEITFSLPIVAPDFITMTPEINADPELALEEAIAEMEKGEGKPKSIALIALSLAKYLKSKKDKIK
jgi:hypothetical protein